MCSVSLRSALSGSTCSVLQHQPWQTMLSHCSNKEIQCYSMQWHLIHKMRWSGIHIQLAISCTLFEWDFFLHIDIKSFENFFLLALCVWVKMCIFFKELPDSQLGLSQPLVVEPDASPKNRCSFLNDYNKVG